MISPEIPQNEEARLKVLRSLQVLDTDPTEQFDRLTRLAKRLFDVPIALVSLVDRDRQWFKSRVGLDACQTGRDISFCGHAILGNDIFMVPDAKRDDRFHDNPLVTEDPQIRFYAGVPLSAPCGSKLGTLCLIDDKPRELNEDDQSVLRDLGSIAAAELVAIQLSSMDDLTDLSNRRGFMTLSGHALSVCRRMAKPAALFYFDLDQFKSINDEFGHAEGDRALVAFAGLLKDTFRQSDVIGRLGGDEFVVFLTGAELGESQATLRRFHRTLKHYNKKARRGYDLQYSVGSVAFDPDRHQAIEDMMETADRRMYQQKRGGRSVRLDVPLPVL